MNLNEKEIRSIYHFVENKTCTFYSRGTPASFISVLMQLHRTSLPHGSSAVVELRYERLDYLRSARYVRSWTMWWPMLSTEETSQKIPKLVKPGICSGLPEKGRNSARRGVKLSWSLPNFVVPLMMAQNRSFSVFLISVYQQNKSVVSSRRFIWSSVPNMLNREAFIYSSWLKIMLLEQITL